MQDKSISRPAGCSAPANATNPVEEPLREENPEVTGEVVQPRGRYGIISLLMEFLQWFRCSKRKLVMLILAENDNRITLFAMNLDIVLKNGAMLLMVVLHYM